MKKILFAIFLLILANMSFAQITTIYAKNIHATDNFQLKTIKITNFVTDFYNADSLSNLKIPTAKAVADYIRQRPSGGSGVPDSVPFFNVKKVPVPQTYAEKEANDQSYNVERISNFPFYDWHDGITLGSYLDTMVVIGGWNAGVITDSIFQSADNGVTWTFRGLFPYKVHCPVSFRSKKDGYFYIIGADLFGTDTDRGSVYRTIDFRNWQLMTNTSPFYNRVNQTGAELDGRLFVGGGQYKTCVLADGIFNDMWVSDDQGVTWSLVANNLPFMGGNVSGTMTSFNDQIVQCSGGMFDLFDLSLKTFRRGLRSSYDGITWEVHDSLPIVGVQYPNLTVWDGKLWFMNGAYQNVNRDTSFFIDKSWNWNMMISGFPSATHASAWMDFNDALYRVQGNTVNQVWKISRSTNKYYKITPTFKTPIAVDTFKNNTNGWAGVWNADGFSYNDFQYINATATNRIRWEVSNYDLYNNNVHSYRFGINRQVDFYVLRLGNSTLNTSGYPFTGYYNAMLTVENTYPAIQWKGANTNFVLGLEDDIVGFRKENAVTTTNGIRIKANITQGTMVVSNNPSANHYAAFTPSAAFEIWSKTKGFLPPRMTSSEASAISVSSTDEGLLLYVTDTNGTFTSKGWWGWNGSAWEKLNN